MKRINYKQEKNCTITITGATENAGTTHLALTIANYLSSKLGKKVIYIEIADKSSLLDIVKGKEAMIAESPAFEYKNVKYCLACTPIEAKEIIINANDYVIVDLQELNDETDSIFALGDKAIVIGSLKDWDKEEYINFIRKKVLRKHDTKKMRFLSVGLINKNKKEFQDIFDLPIDNVPFIENPFLIKQKSFVEIEKLL